MGTAVPARQRKEATRQILYHPQDMKAFTSACALAAAAAATPEANHQLLAQPQPFVYGNSMAHYTNGVVVPQDTTIGYTTPMAVQQTIPLMHQTVASPVVSYTGAYPHVYGTHLIKREADSEAQPEAHHGGPHILTTSYNGVYGAGLYGHQLVNPAVTYTAPLVSNVATVGAKQMVPTVVKTPIVSYNYGLHTPLTTGYTGYTHLIKREADANLSLRYPYTYHPINFQRPIKAYNYEPSRSYGQYNFIRY